MMGDMNTNHDQLGHLEMAKEAQEAQLNAEPGARIIEPNAEENGARGDARPPEGAEGAELLEELKGVMNEYVVLPPMAAEALALWVVHTHAFELREVTTYLGVTSPTKRCGKTTLLTLLGHLARRAMAVSNISPPALFRVIEQGRPTLLIDEVDTFLEKREEFRGILNAGYTRETAFVVRMGQGPRKSAAERTEAKEMNEEWALGGSGLQRFSCWCPKVMAAIGKLPETLADRCIVIEMNRKTASEERKRLRDFTGRELKLRCAEFVQKHAEAIGRAEPSIPEKLNDRAADIWEPLLVIADLAGGEWPELARRAAEELSVQEEEPNLKWQFFLELRELFLNSKLDRMLSSDLVIDFNHRRGRGKPWEELCRGKKINEWWIGWQLREFGIRSRLMTIWGKTARGYCREDIEEAWKRYGG